jgi:hypothetical protein
VRRVGIALREECGDRIAHLRRLQPLGKDSGLNAHSLEDFVARAVPKQALRLAKRLRRLGEEPAGDILQTGLQLAGRRAVTDQPDRERLIDSERFA